MLNLSTLYTCIKYFTIRLILMHFLNTSAGSGRVEVTVLISNVPAPAPQPNAWPPLSSGRSSGLGGILCAGPPGCPVAQSADGSWSWRGRLSGITPSGGRPEAGQGQDEACCPTWWCTEAACCCCCPSTLTRCPGGPAQSGASLAGGPWRGPRA